MKPIPAGARAAEQSLLRLSTPLILSFWMRALFTFVDTIYASFLGDAAIAAIGLSIPLEFVFLACWIGLSTALTSYLAKAMANGDDATFDRLVHSVRGMILALIPVFVLLAVGLWIYAPRLDVDPEVARGFQLYAPVLFGGSAAVGFWSILPDSIVKAHHDTRSTMIAGMLSNVINVVLNTFFTFVLHWGLFGIGLSTVLGRFGGLAYAMQRASTLERERRAARPAGAVVRPVPGLDRPGWPLVKLAVPASASFLLVATEGSLVNWLLSGVEHAKAALAAYSIYYRVVMFAMMPLVATTAAMLPFVARHVGEGRTGLVRRSYHRALAAGAVYCVFLLAPAAWLGAEPLLRSLGDEPQTVAYGTFALYLVPLASLVSLPFQLSRPLFEGVQLGRPSIVMAGLRYLVLAPPLALLGIEMARRRGLPEFHGVMLGLLVATLIGSLVFLAWAQRLLRTLDQAPQTKLGPPEAVPAR